MSFRVLQAQTMARISLGLNNTRNFNHCLLSCPPPPPKAVGAPLRQLSYCPHVVRHPPSCALRAKYGYSPVPPAEGMRMKQSSYDTSGDESSDEPETDDKLKSGYVKFDDDALYFKMDMPGVGKEDVKVYVEGNTHTLWVKGIRKSDSGEISPKTYLSEVSLMPLHEYKVDGIEAEMMNGVLKVTVPKVKIEERMDVFQVNIN